MTLKRESEEECDLALIQSRVWGGGRGVRKNEKALVEGMRIVRWELV